jgi:hypothetical protein
VGHEIAAQRESQTRQKPAALENSWRFVIDQKRLGGDAAAQP